MMTHIPGLPDEALWTVPRLLSATVALAYVAAAALLFDAPTALKAAGSLLLPVLCVWFPAAMGRYSGLGVLSGGMSLTRPTPEKLVRIVGWGFLALPLLLLILFAATTRLYGP